jgi:uncharacterized protein YbjT (DUF2867 family)
MKTRIVIAGGTGLVGKQVVDELLGLDNVELHMLLRPDPGDRLHGGIVGHWGVRIREFKPDVAICCLGTTMKKAGSKAAFFEVDHDLVLSIAKDARRAGTKQFIAISSVGASAESSNFYLKTKGQIENALKSIDFERVDFLRPGLLTGGKRSESRLGESVASLISPLSDLAMLGPLSKYRSTPSDRVARAMVTLALGGGYGRFIHENDSISALSG